MQEKLRDRFKMTDLRDVSHYLQIYFNHIISEKINLCQSTYLKKVLNRLKLTECKPASISIDPRVKNFLLPYDRNTDKETIKWNY